MFTWVLGGFCDIRGRWLRPPPVPGTSVVINDIHIYIPAPGTSVSYVVLQDCYIPVPRIASSTDCNALGVEKTRKQAVWEQSVIGFVAIDQKSNAVTRCYTHVSERYTRFYSSAVVRVTSRSAVTGKCTMNNIGTQWMLGSVQTHSSYIANLTYTAAVVTIRYLPNIMLRCSRL